MGIWDIYGWNIVIHGSLNVPIEHHPTIRYMVYNGYYKVMSNIPKMGHLPTPVISVTKIVWQTFGDASHHLGSWYAPGRFDRSQITWGHLVFFLEDHCWNNQWIGLRENLQETIDFSIKYGAFVPSSNPLKQAIINIGWWYTYASEKYEWVTVGMMKFPIYLERKKTWSKPPTRMAISGT